jgi:integrase
MSEPSQFAPRRFEPAIWGRIAEDRFLEKAEDGTIASATPNRKRGKSMSFRSGQSGNVVPKGQMWHGRFYVDIPGEEKRVRTSVPIGSIHSMKKTEAKRKLRAMLEEMGLNSDRHLERATRGGKTFAAEASWWRENVLSKFKPSCQEAMGSHLDKYLIPHVGSLPMVAIDERRVQELITVLERAEYKWPNGVSRRISPKTIRNIVGVLKLILGERVWRDWKLTFPEETNPDKEQRYFTQSEMIQIVNSAPGQWKVLFALLAGTGLRAGEAFGLQIEDLDLAAGLIRVRRSIWNGRVVTVKTKRAKRPINIEPTIVQMLAGHIGDREFGRVFQTRTGAPLSKSNVRRKLNQLLVSLKLKPAGLHAFRHGRVSMLQANGVPSDLVKLWVGHSNLETTSNYTHFPEEFRSKVARATGLFSQDVGPNGPNYREFPNTGRVM